MPRGRSKYKPGFSRHSKDSKPNWWMRVSPSEPKLWVWDGGTITFAPVIWIPLNIIILGIVVWAIATGNFD